MPEPELDDLSAYLDHELTGTARQELEAHLQTCETCRRRLAALSQTVHAIQELPVEAPPRVFTIPAQRAQPRRIAPVFGWVGGATAAALLVIVVSVSLGRLPHSTSNASSFAPVSGGLAQGAGTNSGTNSERGALAAVPQADQLYNAATPFPHRAPTRTDSHNPARQLLVGSDTASYARTGTIRLEVILQGVPFQTTDSRQAGLQLTLQRDGVGRSLPAPVGVEPYNPNTMVFVGTYRISDLTLPDGAGSYVVTVTWTIPDGSGVVLTTDLPVEISR